MKVANRDPSHVYCCKINNSTKCYEFEQTISPADFEALKVRSVASVVKNRYVFNSDAFREEWVVDILRNEAGERYFVLAECEIPSDSKRPCSMPFDISKLIVYEVPQEANFDYSNYLLADQVYAALKLEAITTNGN